MDGKGVITTEKKYYWLKLKRDFFKRHDIQIIESMPNGKDYILFYLKLLCESVDHEGNLRFNEQIPYNERMLSTITNTNIDIVLHAIKVFTDLHMMEVLDDGTYFMSEVEKLIGSATQDEHTRESTRKRVAAHRERQKQAQIEEKRYSNVTCNGEIEIEKEIEKDIDKDKKSNKGKNKFSPPTLEEVQAYCFERGNNVNPQKWYDHYTSNGWMVGRTKMKDWKAAVRTWENNDLNKQKKTGDDVMREWLEEYGGDE